MYKSVACQIIFILLSTSSFSQQAASLSSKLIEFHQRGALPNFFAKIKAGKPVTVAYLGGSITEAGSGWRDLTFNWLSSSFSNSKFTQVNAAIGGTGSNLGVFRLEQDVLRHRPDLLFVEFAVNDGGPAAGIHKSMEGIVRKTWRLDPATDICFVYTIAENGITALQEGHYQNTAMAMEEIADHYQVPSIHMGVEVIRLLDAGKLVFAGVPEENPGKIVFTKDKVHPLPASGHPIYAAAVIRNFEKMSALTKKAPHRLPAPFIAGNWEAAKMVPLSAIMKKQSWEQLSTTDSLARKFVKYMPELYKASAPGASFTLKFKGTVAGVYDLIGPQTGIVDVVIDGGEPQEIYRFDAWANGYRKNALLLGDLAPGEHTITFTVTGKPFDKAAILAKRSITMVNPDDYKENGWFVSSILLVGELLP